MVHHSLGRPPIEYRRIHCPSSPSSRLPTLSTSPYPHTHTHLIDPSSKPYPLVVSVTLYSLSTISASVSLCKQNPPNPSRKIAFIPLYTAFYLARKTIASSSPVKNQHKNILRSLSIFFSTLEVGLFDRHCFICRTIIHHISRR